MEARWLRRLYANEVVYLGGRLSKARVQLEELEKSFDAALKRYDTVAKDVDDEKAGVESRSSARAG